MISRFGNKNFFVAHYEWIALGVGILALALGAAFYVMSAGANPQDAADETCAEVAAMKPSETGVKPMDMGVLRQAVRLTRSPVQLAEVPAARESFLASERRVFCKKCKKPIIGDLKVCPACPYCGEKQQEEQKVVLDADGDGLPDEWEKKYGLNPNNAADAAGDKDKDDFTNLEEYQAKTDPTDAKDHPDYLDSLKVVLPLKKTYMPFIFMQATQIPGSWRCEFFDPRQKDDYGRMGRTLRAKIGEEIGKSGFVLKEYVKKETKREIKGAKGLTRTVDVSEVTVERKGDKKKVTLVLAPNKKAKPAAVDVQASLVYERGTAKNIDVVPGSEISLSGSKYRIVDIRPVGKGVTVVIENSLTGKKRNLEALEQ